MPPENVRKNITFSGGIKRNMAIIGYKKRIFRSSHQTWSVRKGVLRISQNSKENTCATVSFLIKLKICSKFTGEHPCRSAISIEIALRHGCPPVNLLHIFRTPFFKDTSGWLLLKNETNYLKTSKNEAKLNSDVKKDVY